MRLVGYLKRKLLHVSTPRCHLHGDVITKVYTPSCQLCFVRSFSITETIVNVKKLLKHIKLVIMIVYSIMVCCKVSYHTIKNTNSETWSGNTNIFGVHYMGLTFPKFTEDKCIY